MNNLAILDALLDYINEYGLYEDMLEWYEMYGNDKEQLDEAIEARYDNFK